MGLKLNIKSQWTLEMLTLLNELHCQVCMENWGNIPASALPAK